MPPEHLTTVEIRQDEVLTGEAVALDIQPLSFFQRALGCLIDVIATVVLLIALAVVANWLLGGAFLDAAAAPILGITTVVVAVFSSSLQSLSSVSVETTKQTKVAEVETFDDA